MESASPRQHPLPSATGNQGAKHPLKPLEPIRERGGSTPGQGEFTSKLCLAVERREWCFI